jgi:hypothetical protein
MNHSDTQLLLVIFAFISRHVGAKVAAKIDEVCVRALVVSDDRWEGMQECHTQTRSRPPQPTTAPPQHPQSMQTAQDYAVCVLNPDPGFFDCDAYKTLFSRYGDVVSVTLALNNGALLEAIRDKKELETRLGETVEGERLLEAEEKGYGIELQPPTLLKRLLHSLGLYSDPLFVWREREAVKARVAAAVEHQSTYARVKRVFVIFATETVRVGLWAWLWDGALYVCVQDGEGGM